MSDIEALAVELARLLHDQTQYGMVQLLTPVLQSQADKIDGLETHHADDVDRLTTIAANYSSEVDRLTEKAAEAYDMGVQDGRSGITKEILLCQIIQHFPDGGENE